MTPKTARRLCYIAVLIGVVTCWPAAIVFGKKTVQVDIPGAYAVDCSTDDSMKGTKYPLAYYGCLFLYFIISVVFYTIVYTKIIVYVRKQKKKGNLSKRVNHSHSEEKSGHRSVTEESSLSHIGKEPVSNQHKGEQQTCQPQTRENNKTKRKIRTSKTTFMLGIVTVVFVLSFLPFLGVMVIRNIVKNFEEILSPVSY